MAERAVTTTEQVEREMRAAEIDKSIAFGAHGAEITNLHQAARVAQWAIQSGLFRATKPAEVVMVIQTGMELGFSTVQSLQAFDVIEGKLAMKVDAQAAKVESAEALEPGTKVFFRYEGAGEDLACFAWSTPRGGKRIDSEPVYLRDFKHLRHKDNWKNYPKRMMKARAVGWHIRDYYSAVVRGLMTSEEAVDISDERGTPPVERDVTPPKGPDPLLAGATRPVDPEPTDAEIVEPEPAAEPEPESVEPAETPAPSEDLPPIEVVLEEIAQAETIPGVLAVAAKYRTLPWPDEQGTEIRMAVNARTKKIKAA